MRDRLVEGLENVPAAARRGVLTVGNFDGVHLGHRRILQTARGIADSEGLKLAVLTFEPPPELVLRPEREPRRVLPPAEKARMLLEAGADCVVSARTDQALLAMGPDEFIGRVLIETFAPRHVVEGPNFCFGLGRSGDVHTLRRAGDREGFTVKVVEPVRVDLSGGVGEVRISSTLIRNLLIDGRVEDAAACLGRPFALFAEVIAGRGHGRVLDFPTANVDAGQQVCPADGVYIGKAIIGDDEFPAAVSIGDKPTFGASERTVEAFLIGAEGDFYGQQISLEFLQRLRDQERFADADALKEQIAKDVARVREVCGLEA